MHPCETQTDGIRPKRIVDFPKVSGSQKKPKSRNFVVLFAMENDRPKCREVSPRCCDVARSAARDGVNARRAEGRRPSNDARFDKKTENSIDKHREYERESPAFQCRYFLGTQKVSLG